MICNTLMRKLLHWNDDNDVCLSWTFWDNFLETWWRYQMETFSALLAICAGNSPVPGEFPTQRPVTRSFDVYFDLRPNKRLSKQLWGWWFETLFRPLWRHRNAHQWSHYIAQPSPTFPATSACPDGGKHQLTRLGCHTGKVPQGKITRILI